MKKYNLDDMINALPTEQAAVPKGLYEKVLAKKRQKREIRLTPWQYAAAACIIFLNSFGLYYAWNENQEDKAIDSTEQIAGSYNWDQTSIYEFE
ncbi:hypothetical protein [Reichenbachiella ulvae]|uniref:Uncharacterized protein n=1 Tax=Reichenbachiella ulvae TaxID=2980104 RepID=A0ABT3CYY2_9BACT|nr:hypothetical protein [Reichenbachiella ulvae]MCV9388901.1 hypothetical protein [Reichenbachiella ulvae]